VSRDEELVVVFGLLHLVGIGFGLMFLAMFLRSEPASAWRPDSDDGSSEDGGGGRPHVPRAPTSPRDDGLPLPDALPARRRRREPPRRGDLIPRRPRRPAHPPAPAPVRRRLPSGT
jgi:hypothetical protein